MSTKIGFIGAGNMAQSIAKGFIMSGFVKPDDIMFTAPSNRNKKLVQELGCHFDKSNNMLIEQHKSQIIFLCVKPNIVLDCLENNKILIEIKDSGNLFFISVVAGIPMKKIYSEKLISSHNSSIHMYRSMPNTAVQICQGIIGLSTFEPDEKRDLYMVNILSNISKCSLLPEKSLDAICGISGSGIGFAYHILHAFSDGGVLVGLPRDLSTELAAQVLIGAGEMILKTKKHPIQLRDEVTSPAGTTINGLHELEKNAVPSAIMQAIKTAYEKSLSFSSLFADNK